MVRLGLCCMFRDEPIKFRVTTAKSVSQLARREALRKLSDLAHHNARSLRAALEFCDARGIGCFRVLSQILPLKTHPELGYRVADLPAGDEIERTFRECGDFARRRKLRTCFHPDQFVVLNSPRPDVVASAIQELEYQAEVAEWIGADVINIHGGGAYGDKPRALGQLTRAIERLPAAIRSRLTLENDDTTFTPADLWPVCRATGTPLVYDVHHHRCLPDQWTIDEATRAALDTWNREPLFHISSPQDGWSGSRPERHHDFIELADFPANWRARSLTVEVEARAKEAAVLRLKQELELRQMG